jgi:hypothetical protein
MLSELECDGAQLFRSAVDSKGFEDLRRLLPPAERAGKRIFDSPQLAGWLREASVGSIAKLGLGDAARPVRAILFDKTPDANWALGWHQDRTIAVQQRIDVPGFARWNCKAGAVHVEPPFWLMERMITARIHLDPVPADNAPLLIAPGSHRMGRIAEQTIRTVVDECGSFTCLAEAGDIWLYRTAILHASERSKNGSRRRVLQVDYSAEDLPGGLHWLGVG